MAWFVIPVAIAGAGYVAKSYSENRIVTCSCCGRKSKNKEFEYYNFMGSREEHFAKYWLRKNEPICMKCGQLIEDVYKIVLKKIGDVETYPIEYTGKEYEDRIVNKVPITIESVGASEEDALYELKINAVLHQCDTITDIYYDDRSYEGTFSYTRYIAKGTAYVPKEAVDDRKTFSGAASLRDFIKKNSN